MGYEGEKPWWRPIPKQLAKNKSNRSSQTEGSPSYRAIELLHSFLLLLLFSFLSFFLSITSKWNHHTPLFMVMKTRWYGERVRLDSWGSNVHVCYLEAKVTVGQWWQFYNRKLSAGQPSGGLWSSSFLHRFNDSEAGKATVTAHS